MRKCVFALTFALSACAMAGVGGVVIKGALKTWDEIAKVALKASGRATSKEAVAAASKTLEVATEKYGDDVAKAAMKGGMEVAEQSAKSAGRFVAVIQKAGKASPEALRALAHHADDAIRYTAKYGDDVLLLNDKVPGIFSRGVVAIEKSGVKSPSGALKAISKLPAEDIPRAIGAIEKNPGVAKEFIEGIEKGGKTFVERVFALNGKQILAGTVGAATIIGTIRATAPLAAEGNAIDAQTEITKDVIEDADEKDRLGFVTDVNRTTNKNREAVGDAIRDFIGKQGIGWLVLAVFAGVALVLFVVMRRKK